MLALIVAVTVALTVLFARGLYNALALQNGGTPIHYLFISVACLLFAWIAFGAANAVAGAGAVISGWGRDTLKLPRGLVRLSTRTALLFPIYHEDPQRVAETIETLAEDLKRIGLSRHFDIFVLSDTRTADAREREANIFAALQSVRQDTPGVFYRCRNDNRNKKAGNIADWIKHHGGAYSHFVIFDADSQMSANLLVRLAGAMERHQDTGLIQTVPRLINATTWFSAANSFANNVYGPAFAAGFATWQGPSGNYWGHNAIIRTRAFASSAGLPTLTGRKPFGGYIQSHDFVEAALIRRAGWRVDLVTSADETWEEGPPTMIDMAVRDRRWMQGNIQHLAVVSAGGLSGISRAHLMFGVFSYVSSLFWAALLCIGLWLTAYDQTRATIYFPNERTLFPHWPTFDPDAGLRVLSGTLLILLIPKVAGLLSYLWRHRTSALGTLRLTAGAALETLASTLFAPVMMMVHVRGLLEIAAGQDSGWSAQRRDADRLSFGQALQFHAVHVVVGAVLAVAAWTLSPHAALFMSPVIAGLLLSPVVTWYGAKSIGHHPRTGSQ